jgi:hypothetical protein
VVLNSCALVLLDCCLIKLTTWSRVLLEKLIVTHIVKFCTFYITQGFIIMFMRTCHWSRSWGRWLQSAPSHPISLGSILISSHLCLGLPSGLFPSDFLTKILYASLISPVHVTCPTSICILHFIILTIFAEVYKLWSSLLCSLLQFPTTSSLDSNILLSTLFPYTLNLCSFLSVRDQVSHLYKTISKISLIYFNP